MIGFLWDWSKIIGITIVIMGLAIKGELDPIFAAILIAMYVMIRGAVRGSDGITKTLFWFLEITFILLLCASVLAKAGNIVSAILLIIGLFSETMIWIAKLVIEGHLSVYHGVFFIVTVFILERLGRWIGNFKVHLAAKTAFLIGLPIAMFIVFFAGLYDGGNMWGLLGQFMVLLLSLFGFYVMAFGWSSSRRK